MASLQAEQSKVAGNAAFKALDYPLAIAHYSTAIARDPSVSTYPLNRSLVHLRLGNFLDAFRDANTALDLDGGANVKALFRRGLANKGLGKLDDAKRDFEQAIEQGAGADVETELAQLLKLLESNNSKPTTMDSAPPVASVQSKSDRLRAAISSSTSSPTQSPSARSNAPPTSELPGPPSDDGFGMKAVSTRKLKPTSSTNPAQTLPAPEIPVSSPSATPVTSSSSSSGTSDASTSFAAKKLSRQTRQTSSSPFSIPPPRSAAPPPLSPPPPPPPPASSSQTETLQPLSHSPVPASSQSDPALAPPLRAPRAASSSTTLTSLEAHLVLTPAGSPSRLAVLKSLDPTRRSRFVDFVGDSLTPDLLSLILDELARNLPPSPSLDADDEEGGGEGETEETGWMVELLKGLARCRRFETSRMLLSDEELGVVRRIVEHERKNLETVEGKWGL